MTREQTDQRAAVDPARSVFAGATELDHTLRHRMLALLFAAVAVAAWLPSGYRFTDVPGQLLFASLSATFVALAALQLLLAMPAARQGVTRWRIGPWYLLWSALTFGIAPLTWLSPELAGSDRIALASVVSAVSLFGLSLIPWTLGYQLGMPRPARAFADRGLALLLRGTSPVLRGGGMPWALYGIGTGARLLTVVLTGRFGYVGDPSVLVSRAGPFDHVLRMLATFSLFAIAAAAYRAFSDRSRGSKATLWTLVAAEAAVGALAGGKQYFILSVLAVLIPYGALRGRISLRVLIAGLLIFLWIAVPFNNAYRQVVRGDDSVLTPAAAVAAAPEVLSNVLSQETVTASVSDSTLQMLKRLRMIDSVAITIQLTPEVIPYRNPTELASAPVIGLIPRALWPDKPVITTGYDFNQEYLGRPSDMYSSVGVTPLGDLYRHGGPITVVVGMLLLGMCARLFDSRFRPERDPRALCFLLVFFPILLRADIYGMLLAVPSGLLLAAVGARLMCQRPVRAG